MKEIALVLLGLFSGAILSWIQFKYIWINQRKLEEKFKTLDEAAKAIALFEREALDPEIQNKKEFIIVVIRKQSSGELNYRQKQMFL
jgi:hypothetical protein